MHTTLAASLRFHAANKFQKFNADNYTNFSSFFSRWQEEIISKHFPVQCGKHIDVVIMSEQERYVVRSTFSSPNVKI